MHAIISRNSHERLRIRSRHTFCASFSGLHSFTFVYGFQSGYLERLKEQLNEVKTRPRGSISLNCHAFFPCRPSIAEIRLVLFQRCVTGLSPGPALVHTFHSAANSYTADTVMSRRYFNCRLKATLSRPDARILRQPREI